MKNLKKFTLIELLVVIAIIAILAGLLQPTLFQAKQKAHYISWRTYTRDMQANPLLVGQWLFEDDEDNDNIASNTARGLQYDQYNQKNYNGTIYNCVKSKSGRWPRSKGAIYFNGNTNSYVEIKDNLGILNPKTKDFSIVVWFKPTTSHMAYIISKGNSFGRKPGWSFYANRKLYMRAASVQKKRYKNRTRTFISINQWHMAALVFDRSNNQMKWYLDGKNIFSRTIDKGSQVNDFSTDEPLIIGKRNRRNGAFQGYIDEIEIFSTALTAKKIEEQYKIGLPPGN